MQPRFQEHTNLLLLAEEPQKPATPKKPARLPFQLMFKSTDVEFRMFQRTRLHIGIDASNLRGIFIANGPVGRKRNRCLAISSVLF